MKVSELAKELGTSSDAVLETLKSLKLKAKGGQQELSAAVVSVVKSAVKKGKKVPVKKTAVKKEDPKAKKDKKPKSEIKEKVKKAKKVLKTSDDKKAKVKKTKTTIVKKKKTVVKDRSRPKVKISREPLITLKPLQRKRKKTILPSRESRQVSTDRLSADTSLDSKGEPLLAGASDQGVPTAEDQSLPETIQKRVSGEKLEDLEVKVPITVKDLSVKMQQKPSVVLKQLMTMGIFANINQSLDADIVEKIAPAFGFNISEIKTQEEYVIESHKVENEDPKLLKSRAPVITFMGHVDHGKTTLLDKIRKSKVVDSEHGGITQHIGAYSVNIPKGRITLLDTPGHEAFTAMRARGAHITDLVVLVIAADEGIMPQTKEAIDHARAANVPIVVALSKIDRKNADMDKVKKELSEEGLMTEDWGGKTICVGVSGITGEGVDQLLEMILLEAELLELKANPDKRALGIVVEAHLSQGKGVVTTLIVQGGTLNEGDYVVVGPYYGKIKAMLDDHERTIQTAGPSMPVEILGLPDVPEAGEMFYVVENEKQAREISFKRQEEFKERRLHATSKVSLEDLYSQIQEGSIKELNVVLKADVQGSLEALKDSLEKIPSDKVKIKFIHTGIGEVNASDVLLALASKAIIIAFHVDVGPRAKEELEKEPVDVRKYRIIYDAVNDVKNALEGLLEAKQKKKFLSRIEIREVFKLSKHGIIAGCYVTKGKVHRKANIDIIRSDELLFSGKISSLKRFKDDVREVNEGMECGISVEGFDGIQKGDIIEAYELEAVAQTL